MRDYIEDSEGGGRAGLVVGIIALLLLAPVSGACLYLFLRLGPLTATVGRLEDSVAQLIIEQAEMKETLADLKAQLDKARERDQLAAPSAVVDGFVSFDGGPIQPLGGAARGAAPDASAASSTPPAPNGVGSGYTVRVFAPASSLDKAKLDRFAALVKASGFNIDISQDDVSQPVSLSVSYNPAAADIAAKLVSVIRGKYPAMRFEMNASAAIPENLKQVLIVNLTSDSLN